MKSATKKVDDGKLVTLSVDILDNVILDVKITGDFFLFPESVIFEIESAVKETPIPVNTAELEKRINDVLKFNNAKLVGVSAENIAQLLLEVSR